MFSKFPGGCTVKLGVKTYYGWLRMDNSEPEFPHLFDHIFFLLLLSFFFFAVPGSILYMDDATIEVYHQCFIR